ncbi:MAG: D-2-hydroxyacid dehydrogenase [Pseudomonadota bacterium]
MKAAFLDYGTMGPGLDLKPLYDLFPDMTVYESTTDDELIERIAGVSFVFTNKMRFDDAVMSAAPDLKFIGLTATGTDNIDLEMARKAGIAVANIRAYCTESIVEHVFGVLLMLTHSLPAYDADTRGGDWQRSTSPLMLTHPIEQLSEMTLGIVGYGALGKGVATMAQNFGMRVLVSARPSADTCADDRTAFDEVLRAADVISLHCPLNDTTRNLINADTLAQMKPRAILINTARGGLVDSQALADALRAGHLWGAAIDVLPQEPPRDGDPLLDYEGDNLIVTPHIAWGTTRARQNAIDQLAANAVAFIAGEEKNRVA